MPHLPVIWLLKDPTNYVSYGPNACDTEGTTNLDSTTRS